MRNEIIRAILKASDFAQKVAEDCTHVEGCAEDMADEILKVLGKDV